MFFFTATLVVSQVTFTGVLSAISSVTFSVSEGAVSNLAGTFGVTVRNGSEIELRCTYNDIPTVGEIGVHEFHLNADVKPSTFFSRYVHPPNPVQTNPIITAPFLSPLRLVQRDGLNFGGIRVNPILLTDENTYKCQVVLHTFTSLAASNVKINVVAVPHVPMLSMPPGPIVAGQKLTLTCSTNVGKPKGQLKWLRQLRTESSPIVIQKNNTVSDEAQSDGSFHVTESYIVDIVPDTYNGAKFICEARNDALTSSEGSPKAEVTLLVRYPVRDIKVIPIVRLHYPGDQFKCEAMGNPAPGYRWIKVKGSQTLTISRNKLSIPATATPETLVYRCVAFNTPGSSEVQISYTLIVNITLVRPGVPTIDGWPEAGDKINEAAEFSITCKAATTGGAVDSFEMYLGTTKLPTAGPKGETYKVTAVTIANAGDYRCNAINSAGSTESARKILYVVVKPGVPTIDGWPAAGDKINEAAEFSITCKAATTGGAVDSFEMYLGTTKLPTAGPKGETYKVTAVTIANAGDYRCKAINSAGSAESTRRILYVVEPGSSLPIIISVTVPVIIIIAIAVAIVILLHRRRAACYASHQHKKRGGNDLGTVMTSVKSDEDNAGYESPLAVGVANRNTGYEDLRTMARVGNSNVDEVPRSCNDLAGYEVPMPGPMGNRRQLNQLRPQSRLQLQGVPDDEFKSWLLSKQVTEETYDTLVKHGFQKASMFAILDVDSVLKLSIQPLAQELLVQRIVKSFNTDINTELRNRDQDSIYDDVYDEMIENPYTGLYSEVL